MRSSGKGVRDIVDLTLATACVSKILLYNDQAMRLVSAVGRATTAGGTRNTGVLNAADVPHDGDTVTIGDVVYTLKTALSVPAVPYEVLIGGSAAIALDNIKAAVNGDAGEGTTYATGTVKHPLAIATTNTATDQTIEASGTAGGALDSLTTGSGHLTFGGAALAGGAALTVQFEVLDDREALTYGVDLLDTEVDLSGLPNKQYAAVVKAHPANIMAAGTWLAMVVTGTPGTVAGAQIEILRRRLSGAY